MLHSNSLHFINLLFKRFTATSGGWFYNDVAQLESYLSYHFTDVFIVPGPSFF